MAFQLLKVGSDTEFFLSDLKTGEPVTAIGRFGGTKQYPKPIEELGEGFCIQEDNVMPEVNIPPASNYNEFYQSVDKIRTWLKNEAYKQGLALETKASMKFTPDKLDHPQAKTIGCEPDFCVWTRSENLISEEKRKMFEFLRSAGGHIHISIKNTNGEEITEENQELLVMTCDLRLGVPSVICDPDVERRKLYGKAGAFRPKRYGNGIAGIEYRVLSNWWFSSDQTSYWVYCQAQQAVKDMNKKPIIRRIYDQAEDIQNCINNQDIDLARNIMDAWEMRLP